MTQQSDNYIISGGQTGKSRLNILAGVLYPYTKPLLETQGLAPGTAFLDLGCGGGNVSLMAASIVGDTGRVAGVDFDKEIIALAWQDAQALSAGNVSFEVSGAYDIHYNNEFDMAYARFLLSHLQHPATAVNRMVQAVKPGGKVVVEDVHFCGHFCYPRNEVFEQYVQLYMKAAKKNGHNPEIGPALFGMFNKVGLIDVGFDVIQPCFNTGDGKWMAYITMDRIKDALLKNDLADEETINSVLAQLEAFTKDETTIISLPRIFRVWGRKKPG